MKPWKRVAGIASVTTGVLGAAVVGGVTAGRRAVRRHRSAAGDPGVAPFDALAVDREYSVSAPDGTVLHVEEVGPEDAALTVVFAHGWLLRIGSWHYQRLALAHTRPDLRLVFYDQRSHGRSGRATPGHSSLADLADDLGAVVDTAAPSGPVVLVGHSMGGMALLGLAAARPDLFAARVAGVGLLSTAMRGGGGAVVGRVLAGAGAPVLRLVGGTVARYPGIVERSRATSREAAWLLARSVGFARADVGIELVDYLDEMISATPVDVITDFMPAFLGLDLRGALPALAGVPVGILVGDADRVTPPARSAAIASALPHAELTVVPGAGHMVTLEAPTEVDAALERLLARAEAYAR